MTSRGLKFEHLVVLVGVVVGVALGANRIGDNSTLVHITTGLNIINTGHIPRTDPYSFTAHGQPWVVQSWIPEVLYGFFYKLAGGHGLQVLNMVLYGVLGGVLGSLARTGNWVRTGLLLFIAIGFGASQWSPRPTAFEFLYLALTVLVVARGRSKWWLIPIGLLWVNSHGSWFIGIAYLLAIAVGARLDKSDWRKPAGYGAVLAGAMVVGGLLSPSHLRTFTFPLEPLGSRSNAFATIIEWKSPNFRSSDFSDGTMILITLLLSLWILFRHRPTWSEILPVGLLLTAALIGLRNLPLLGIGIAPVLARAWKTEPVFTAPPGKRFYISANAGLPGWAIAVAVGLIGAVAVGNAYREPGLRLNAYPVGAVNWMQTNGLLGADKRVYAEDWLGCYMVFKYDTKANIFIDDRYDMYPASVSNDSFHLNDLDTNIEPILQKYNFTAVLLPRGAKLSVYLAVDPNWRNIYADKSFEVFQPRLVSGS